MSKYYKISIVIAALFFIVNEGFTQLNADFFAESTQSCLMDSVKFINTSTGDYNLIVWDFNDDGVPDLSGDPTIDASLNNPTYLYQESGLYSVKLIIKNDVKVIP
jgi:PKD repeat protein